MSAVLKRPKPKRCKVCLEHFTPWRTTQKVCGPSCAVMQAKRDEAKRRKREKREGLVRLRTVSDWTKLAQVEFNRFVRMRDADKPCISCDRHTGAKRNAGHYLSTGSHPELRFDERNVHAQCEHCNSYLSGNAVAYRVRLIQRIGLPGVEALEGPHEPKRYRIDELIAIRDTYRAKCNELKKRTV